MNDTSKTEKFSQNIVVQGKLTSFQYTYLTKYNRIEIDLILCVSFFFKVWHLWK